jgi:hypothetical protein
MASQWRHYHTIMAKTWHRASLPSFPEVVSIFAAVVRRVSRGAGRSSRAERVKR